MTSDPPTSSADPPRRPVRTWPSPAPTTAGCRILKRLMPFFPSLGRCWREVRTPCALHALPSRSHLSRSSVCLRALTKDVRDIAYIAIDQCADHAGPGCDAELGDDVPSMVVDGSR